MLRRISLSTTSRQRHILGEYFHERADTLVLIPTIIHGNESSGKEAFERFFSLMHNEQIPVRAHIVGLQGNIEAYQRNVRYIDEDLNRLWTKENWHLIRMNAYHPRTHEGKVFVELIHTIQDYRHKLRPRQIIWLDLHCTSSPRGTFIVTTRHHANLFLAAQLDIPVVLGLDNILRGTAIRFFSEMRHTVSLAVEGGQIGDPQAVDVHHAVIWTALKAAGFIDRSYYSFINPFEQFLSQLSANLPHKVIVRYGHFIDPSYQFKMLPGFRNFDYIRKGSLLATQWDGPVYAPISGYLLMPLYQPQGHEGFYIARPIKH